MGVLLATVYQLYPDKASAPRTFPDGLERELGGAGALPVSTWTFDANRVSTDLSGEDKQRRIMSRNRNLAPFNECIENATTYPLR